MKIKIDKKSLVQCLDTVSKAIPNRAIMPITNNLLFLIKDGRCVIYAYNGKLQIRGQIAVDSKEEFGMCVPANTLLNTVKFLGDDEFTFNYDPEAFVLQIVAGKKKYKLKGFDPKDFPIQKTLGDDNVELKIQTSKIIDHIRTLSKIVDWSEMRESLAGITVLTNNGVVEVTGANSGRYFYRGVTDVKPGNDFFFVLHKDISIALGAAAGTGDTHITLSKKNISIKMDSFEYISVLMAVSKPLVIEKYLDYDINKHIVVDKNDLLGGLRRLSNYSNDDSTIILSIKGDSLKMSSENVNYSIDGEEVLDIKNKDFNDRDLGFSITYLLSILSNISGEKIRFIDGSGKIRMLCLQDYENAGETEMWGIGEHVLAPKPQEA